MSVPSALLRSALRCPWNLSRACFSMQCSTYQVRNFATHRESVNLGSRAPHLSQSLDTGRSRSSARPDTVGPFQLGISQQALRGGEKVKKWSELSTGGKVMRTASQTKNLTVILIGAGLATLLIYTITSEMYSSNSPTNLFKDASERIKCNPRARHSIHAVLKYLNGPLTFHNNPPSLVRPRHRNRHVTSQVFVDAHGNEHMIMTFYIQGRPEGSTPLPSEIGYYEAFSHWVQEKSTHLPELSLDEVIVWTRDRVETLWERSRQTFKYLSGAPVAAPPLPDSMEQGKQAEKREEERKWSFTGMFSSIKGSRGGPDAFAKVDNRTFTEGEVHADLVRNSRGYFVFRYLLVDIPNTRDPNPVRVFVERAPGVRDNEPVMRWVAP
ncbi:Mitochondrial import inner membrane translocase subunit tim21 [Leucoagaricus sp. SymC.cos]|nr:Mitochondrial import inner membrane translocase subunit tim21 [Leucoagaricus sp. SymC.cos]